MVVGDWTARTPSRPAPLEVAEPRRLRRDRPRRLNEDDDYVSDAERAGLVAELIAAGHADRILLSSSAIGVAYGDPRNDLPYSHVLTTFVPLLRPRASPTRTSSASSSPTRATCCRWTGS